MSQCEISWIKAINAEFYIKLVCSFDYFLQSLATSLSVQYGVSNIQRSYGVWLFALNLC